MPMYEGLNHWGFVIPSYAVTLIGTGLLIVLSWRAMVRAEARRDNSRRERER